MKILLSSYHNPHFITITEYIEHAIEKLDHELIKFDDRQHIFPGRIRNKIKWLDEFDQKYLNKNFVSIAFRTKPEIAVIAGGHRINKVSIQALNENKIETVLWTIDPPRNFQPIQEAASAYKHVFCQGSEAIKLLKQNDIKNTYWLPMGCDPCFHHPVKLTPEEQVIYGNDIVFVGSYYPNRHRLLEKLSNFDFGIWGPGWENVKQSSDFQSHIKGKHTKPPKWIKIYSASKIVLAPHFQDSENKFDVFQASPRVFEAMACGAFVISDYQEDVFKLFKDGMHLVGFKSEDELIEKIQYYLHNSKEREIIAKNGQEEVVKNHQYVDRVKKLLSIVGRD
jgi:spore maturation protein CgeB